MAIRQLLNEDQPVKPVRRPGIEQPACGFEHRTSNACNDVVSSSVILPEYDHLGMQQSHTASRAIAKSAAIQAS